MVCGALPTEIHHLLLHKGRSRIEPSKYLSLQTCHFWSIFVWRAFWFRSLLPGSSSAPDQSPKSKGYRNDNQKRLSHDEHLTIISVPFQKYKIETWGSIDAGCRVGLQWSPYGGDRGQGIWWATPIHVLICVYIYNNDINVWILDELYIFIYIVPLILYIVFHGTEFGFG